MKLTEFLQDLGPMIAFSPRLCPILGGTGPTVFCCQLLYWDGKQKDPDGWIYKTMEEIREETGLTRTEQETCRKRLKAKGFLEEKYQGLPRKLYFRVNKEALNQAWQRHRELARHNAENPQYGEEEAEDEEEPTHNNAENPHTIMRETCIIAGAKSAHNKGQNPQAYKGTEITAKSTELLSKGV